MGQQWFDRAGVPIHPQLASDLRRMPSYLRVAHSKIIDTSGMTTLDVSTVWLGLDCSAESDGPPVVFETMIFDADGEEVDSWRYCTEPEAREGHTRAVVEATLTMTEPIVTEIGESEAPQGE